MFPKILETGLNLSRDLRIGILFHYLIYRFLFLPSHLAMWHFSNCARFSGMDALRLKLPSGADQK